MEGLNSRIISSAGTPQGSWGSHFSWQPPWGMLLSNSSMHPALLSHHVHALQASFTLWEHRELRG